FRVVVGLCGDGFIHALIAVVLFFFSSRRRHTRSKRDWSSDVCSSDLQRCLWHGSPCLGSHAVRRRASCTQTLVRAINGFDIDSCWSLHVDVLRNNLKVFSERTIVESARSEEHTSELQSRFDIVCHLLLEK